MFDTGIGAVLSQRSVKDNWIHPCAFLSPAEQNYHVGDKELLAVKAALEEWRHWFGGGGTAISGLDGPQQSRISENS